MQAGRRWDGVAGSEMIKNKTTGGFFSPLLYPVPAAQTRVCVSVKMFNLALL